MPKNAIVLFATGWGAQHGGINSLNYDLATQLRLLAPTSVEVLVVITLTAEEPEPTATESLGYLLFRREAEKFDGIASWLSSRGVDSEVWWIGHDTHTGGHALAVQEQLKRGRFCLFVHSDPLAYDAYKLDGGTMETLDKRRRLENLARSAQLLLGVGPKLERVASEISRQAGDSAVPVARFIPGIIDAKVAESPSQFRAFFAGRFDTRTAPLKQLNLAVDAFASGVKAKLLGKDASLVVFGVPEIALAEVKNRAETLAGRQVNMIPLPFSTDRNAVIDTLRKSSVAMMLSVHEGFGLTGWEALSCGVPLVLSVNSGLYEFLDEEGGHVRGCVIPIEVSGASRGTSDVDVDKLREILGGFREEEQRRKRDAKRIQVELGKKYSWVEVVRRLLGLFGLPFDRGESRRLHIRETERELTVDEKQASAKRTGGGDGSVVVASPGTPSQSVTLPVAVALVSEGRWLEAAQLLERLGYIRDARACAHRAISQELEQARDVRRAPQFLLELEARVVGQTTDTLVEGVRLGGAFPAEARLAATLVNASAGNVEGSLQAVEVNRFVVRSLGERLTRALGATVINPLEDPLRAWAVPPALHAMRLHDAASALTELVAEFRSSRRRRSAVEAPVKKTGAVIDLLLSVVYARLGDEALAGAARYRALIELGLSDPVYAQVARDCSFEQSDSRWWLPLDFGARVMREMEAMQAYRYLRLKEVSYILNNDLAVHAAEEVLQELGANPKARGEKAADAARGAEQSFVSAVRAYVCSIPQRRADEDVALSELANAVREYSAHRLSAAAMRFLARVNGAVIRRLILLGRRDLVGSWRTLFAELFAAGRGWVFSIGVPDDSVFPVPTGELLGRVMVGSVVAVSRAAEEERQFLEWLKSVLWRTPDSFNTNTHFSLVEVAVYDALAVSALSSWYRSFDAIAVGDV